MPNPAELGRGTDSNAFWVPDFSPSHYDKLIYTATGLTQRVRPISPAPTAGPASTCAATPSRTTTGR